MSLKPRESSASSRKSLKLNIRLTLVTMTLVTVLIGIFGAVVFYNMEQTAIKESIDYMQTTMERRRDSISSNVNAINMTTQFFLSNERMNEVLAGVKNGDDYSTGEWLEIYRSDVAALERLINTNPVIYGARYYAVNDDVQEMMPLLYSSSRMQKQEWSSKVSDGGFFYDYRDNLFTTGDRQLLALITPIDNRQYGRIGYIETCMEIGIMFPSLYEDMEGETSCFITDDGRVIYGNGRGNDIAGIASDMSDMMDKNRSTDASSDIETVYEKHGKYVVSGMYIRELSGTLISVDDISGNINDIYRMRTVFICVSVLSLILLAIVINMLVNLLLTRFYEVLSTVRTVRGGDLSVRAIHDDRSDEMGELAYQINRMLDRIQQLMRDNLDRELLAKDSQLRALQNQINAHFIYNVLESVKMMAEIKEEYDISDAITSLGKLLRYSMKWTAETVNVSEELEYIRNYMALINLRFDYEIFLSVNMSDRILEQKIPKMTLQPIIENAIIHGIEEIAEDTTIYIKGIETDDACIIEITDNGRGMSEDELDRLKKKISGEIPTSGGSGNGIGLKNVQDRIRMAFGDEYGIEVLTKEGCYTKVCVKMPADTGRRAET